jgi:hypothetical protein
MKTLLVLLLIVPFAMPGWAQRPRAEPNGIRQGEQVDAQAQKNIPPPLYQRSPTDLNKLQVEADQLAKAAESVPIDIQQIRSGKLPKDTIQKLKDIEKLAKRLRGELTQ